MTREFVHIHPSAKLAPDVEVGPGTVIGPEVEVGKGTWIGPHVVITGPTKIGKNNQIFQFSSIGEKPQDKKFQNETSHLEIGDGNTIREFCTINRGSKEGGGVTRIGNNNWIMAYVHVAHDCLIANETIFVNNASLAGHVVVDDYAVIGGFTGVHQFCHIGAHSFISKSCFITKDVLPYVLIGGENSAPYGLNKEGLKRRGFSAEEIRILKQAYKIVFRQGLTSEEALPELQALVAQSAKVQPFIDGLQRATRGIMR